MTITRLVLVGVGIFGVNVPVGWGFDIVNFVWWIGIGHAGTLISAILLLLRQKWRTSINRFAEAMTIFAVVVRRPLPAAPHRAALARLLAGALSRTRWACGRNFRSPLIWDVFAVTTYATVSLLFWYVGLIPDLATLRDRSKRLTAKIIYGMLALGWRGSAYHWQRYETASLLLAGLATPLVVSVHTVVSFDFAAGIIPGWHATIFPPYFVAGAIYAGFAMVMTLAIPAAQALRPRGLHHPEAPRQHGQDHAGHRPDRGLRLRHRGLHGLVQRQHLRALHDVEPGDRPVQAHVLGPHLLQRAGAPDPLVPEDAAVDSGALRHGDGRERRHVAGALRHHRRFA